MSLAAGDSEMVAVTFAPFMNRSARRGHRNATAAASGPAGPPSPPLAIVLTIFQIVDGIVEETVRVLFLSRIYPHSGWPT